MKAPRILVVPACCVAICWCWRGGDNAFAALDVPVQEPIDVMQHMAAAGDPSAQFNLALVYQEGRGVERDAGRALGWYRKAASAGFSRAQFNLGVMLTNGEGAPRDDKEAAK
jgi:TPR repeat protein